MTRKEQIIQAAKDSWFVEDDICDAVTFQKGAEWADANPNWHKFPDEKPKESGSYMIAYTCPDIEGPTVGDMYYDKITDKWDFAELVGGFNIFCLD